MSRRGVGGRGPIKASALTSGVTVIPCCTVEPGRCWQPWKSCLGGAAFRVMTLIGRGAAASGISRLLSAAIGGAFLEYMLAGSGAPSGAGSRLLAA